MSAGINRYKADLREMSFVLFEQFGYAELVSKAPYEAWGVEEATAVLTESYRFVKDVLGPLNSTGDRQGCRLENGQVYTPAGFKDAWQKLYEAGFKSLSIDPAHGGQGAPQSLFVLVEELISGANTAFSMYPALSFGVADLLAECGSPDQQKFCEKLLNGTWGGTMCLTEPQAGSDVGAASTTAKKNADGTYAIRGTKIFISGGDHDLADNILHLVLARIDGAPAGTKGLSLFIVPKFRLNADGSAGAANDVQVASIEHKMGINGSSTCVLNFGDADGCVGTLVGNTENIGMSQMFKMMNGARIAVGLQGLSVASSAYLNALDYAKDRKQGADFRRWKDPQAPRVPILQHPDVRRMLLECKATVEGIRMLVVKLASHVDRAKQLAGSDDEKAAYHHGQVELLTPLVKAYSSEEAFRLTAQTIQIFGGAGFLKDHPVEQYCRDAKIFSIYEGTTHIQAMDLVGRKLGQAGGAHFQQFLADISQFVETHRAHPAFDKEVAALGAAQEAILQVAMSLLGWSQSDKVALVPLTANRFLWMMSQLAVGWLLLDAGVRSEEALKKLSATDPDRSFYEGKRASAQWYGRNVIPQVENMAKMALIADESPMQIADEAFATV